MSRLTHVVAAAVSAADGRVLIAQRPPGKALAGAWEFPGGKLETGEDRAAGLARELREELGIVIRDPRPLLRLRHAYDFGDVLIDMWVVTRYDGVPHGKEGQAVRWCTPAELAVAQLLPADRPIVRALALPERLREGSAEGYVVEGMGDAGAGVLRGAWCADLGEAGTAACARAEFLVMRRVVPEAEVAALCAAVPVPVYARLGSVERAWELGATGVCDISESCRPPV